MKAKTASVAAKRFAQLKSLAVIIQTGTQAQIIAALVACKASANFATIMWQKAFLKMIALAIGGTPKFEVFDNDSASLQVFNFPQLPSVFRLSADNFTSFSSPWYNASAFARQAQNTYFLRFNRRAIDHALTQVK